MAYNSANLFRLFDSASGLNEWQYLTTDTFATVTGAGYINDGYIQGVNPGDSISVIVFTTQLSDGTLSGFSSFNPAVVSTVTAYGAATVANPAVGGVGASLVATSTVGLLDDVDHDADYTLVVGDAGKSLHHASASTHSWTVPASTFAKGNIVRISTGQSSGTLSVLAGSGLTLNRCDGTAGTGTRTLAAASTAVLYFKSATVAEISGTFAS